MSRAPMVVFLLVLASCAEPAPNIQLLVDLGPQREGIPYPVVWPEVIDFGEVNAGHEAEATFFVSNQGSAPLVVNQAIFQGTGEYFFVQHGSDWDTDWVEEEFIAWNPPLVIPPSKTTMISAHFLPTLGAPTGGRLVLLSNATPLFQNPVVRVFGTGIKPCLVVESQELHFSQDGGQTKVTIHGCDSGVRILDIALNAPPLTFALDLYPLSPFGDGPWHIGPGKQATFSVVAFPQGIGSAQSTGTIEIHTTSSDIPLTVALHSP